MDENVARYLAKLQVGIAVDVGGISIVPLLSTTPVGVDYIGFKTALEKGTFAVEELNEDGVVGRLRVVNSGPGHVLLLDGEELSGAKQNRVLNTTILAAANSHLTIPVSCTEQGRWSYMSSRFADSFSVAPPRIRRSNQSTMADSLRHTGVWGSNQPEVWSRVREISDEAGVHSSTAAMRDVFEARLPILDEIVGRSTVTTNQVGLVAMVNGIVLGMDVISRPEVYRTLHQKLARSYVLDAYLKRRTDSACQDASHLAAGFIGTAMETLESRHESVGLGHDHRYTGKDIVGSALTHENHLIHCAFFSVPPGERSARVSDGIAGHAHRRSYRM